MTRSEFADLSYRGRTEKWPIIGSTYNMSRVATGAPYPFVDSRGGADVRLAVVNVYQCEETTSNKVHTVVVACIKDEFFIWCGDSFLEGKKHRSGPSAAERIGLAADCVPLANQSAVAKQTEKLYGSVKLNTGCHFWPQWESKKRLCKHANSVIQSIAIDELDLLQQKYDSLMATGSVAPTRDTQSILAELAFQVPILIEGDRGSGKTHNSFAFAKSQVMEPIVIQGHESLESIDLLGYFLPNSTHGGVWKDGRLSEAFRLAQAQPAMVIIDEMLRIPQRHLSILLSAFTPIDGYYFLNTGRIVGVRDGIGTEEMLKCPVKNLCVIATTNVGGEYAVDAMDPALAERFMILREDTNHEKLQSILTQAATVKGFTLGTVDALLGFFGKLSALGKQGLVARMPTIRTLTRVITLARAEADIPRWVESSMMVWVGRDVNGFPIAEQVSAIKKVIAATWPCV